MADRFSGLSTDQWYAYLNELDRLRWESIEGPTPLARLLRIEKEAKENGVWELWEAMRSERR